MGIKETPLFHKFNNLWQPNLLLKVNSSDDGGSGYGLRRRRGGGRSGDNGCRGGGGGVDNGYSGGDKGADGCGPNGGIVFIGGYLRNTGLIYSLSLE